MSSFVLLYVPAPDGPCAEKIAAALLTKSLAACVNISAPTTSLYMWEGELEKTSEVVMFVKTKATLAGAARELIIQQHPYDLPCIISVKIDAANSHQPFLDWVDKSCAAPSKVQRSHLP